MADPTKAACKGENIPVGVGIPLLNLISSNWYILASTSTSAITENFLVGVQHATLDHQVQLAHLDNPQISAVLTASLGFLVAAASAPGRRVRVQVLVGRAAAVRRAVVAAACRADGGIGAEPRTGKLRSVGRWQLASQHD